MVNTEPERREAARASDSLSSTDTVPAQEMTAISNADLPSLARRAVETYVRQSRIIEPEKVSDSHLLSERAACFVSIKTLDGDLRGCIGTIEPARATLAEEIITNAAHAATRDPRFFPIGEDELPCLCYSVDVLFEPEPAEFKDLDPSRYGVIVEDAAGIRRGLLLPDIEGVETAEQQFQIAARKAGIALGEPVRLYRFRVQRFRETNRPGQKSSEPRSVKQMADNTQTKTSLGESTSQPELKPDATPNPVEDLNPANDERALDYGESGQYAPGGRYNELNVSKPRRIDLDEQVDSALKKED